MRNFLYLPISMSESRMGTINSFKKNDLAMGARGGGEGGVGLAATGSAQSEMTRQAKSLTSMRPAEPDEDVRFLLYR